MRNLKAHTIILVLLFGASRLHAEEPRSTDKPAESKTPEPAAPALDFETPDTDVEWKSTDIGVRFTPSIAQAMGKQMARDMKRRYDLDDEQFQRAQEVFSKNLMKLAQKSQKPARDSIELFITNMIENEGEFSKKDGQKWAETTLKFLPDVKDFLTTSSAQIGKSLTLSQRLKLTGDMAGVSAGFVMFEERLKKWEKGEIPSDFANPFVDRKDRATSQPQDNGERNEVRTARERAERRVEWETNVETRWPEYVEAAIKFYEFDAPQAKSARGILAESLSRAKQIKSADWAKRIHDNRISAQLSSKLPGELNSGPWMWQLDHEYQELIAPLQTLGDEMRGRIDGLVQSAQREKATARVRDGMKKLGYEPPPS